MSMNLEKTKNTISWEDFYGDWKELDDYELTELDKGVLLSPAYKNYRNTLNRVVPSLSDEKLMNYFIALDQIVLIKWCFMNMSDEDRQGMTGMQYRIFSKYVMELHKIRQDPIIKGFYKQVECEVNTRDLDTRKRISILTKVFQSPMSMFCYLVDKMNTDDDIPFWIDINKIENETDIEVNLLLTDEIRSDNSCRSFIQNMLEQLMMEQ